MAWLTGWSNRVKITVDHTKVGGADLTDFPVYFNMAGLPAGYWVEQDNTDDIRVVTSDGTPCPRDIGYYAAGAGSGVGELYFKAPTLSHTVDTVFYLYYGNAAADPPVDNTATWSAYLAVYLFNEQADEVAETLKNHASATLYHGTGASGIIEAVGAEDYVAGKLGKAWFLNGLTAASNDAWVNLSDDNTLNFNGTDFTVSALVRSTTDWSALPDYYFITKGNVGTAGWWLYGYESIVYFDSGTKNYEQATVDLPFATYGGQWLHLSGIHRAGGANSVYLNGIKGTDGTGGDTNGTTQVARINGTYASSSAGNAALPTEYSQVRIASGAKTDGWILAEYNNTSSPATFYTAVDFPDDTDPVVADLALAPTGPYAPGDAVTVTWTATDDIAVTNEQVLASYDGGGTWAELTSGVLGGTYEWAVPSEETAQARIKVVATDAEANAGEASTGDFTIAAPAAPSGRARQAMYVW